MIKILDLENIKVVGKNKKHQPVFIHGKVRQVLTAEYRDFKKLLVLCLKNKTIRFDKADKLYFEFDMYHDADSPIGCLFDALEESGIVDNDRNILNYEVVKNPIKRGSPARIKIYIIKNN